MKKLDYNDAKVIEIVQMLNDLKFDHKCEPTCIDIKVVEPTDYRRLQHEIDKIFYQHPKPPISKQFDHSSNTLSLFDPR